MKTLTQFPAKPDLLANASQPVCSQAAASLKDKQHEGFTHQNLNSGSLRMNGRNSSFCLVGNEGPSSERQAERRSGQVQAALSFHAPCTRPQRSAMRGLT